MMDKQHQLKEANEALEKEDYDEAASLFAPLAEYGIAEAQRNYGTLFQLGLGVERNLKRAVELLELAAASGDGLAAHNLGTLYLSGEPDIPMDKSKSKHWYKRAKDLGFIAAGEGWYNDLNGSENNKS